MHGHLVQVAKIKERASINLPFFFFILFLPLSFSFISFVLPSPSRSSFVSLSLRTKRRNFFSIRRYDGCSRSPITGLQFRHPLRRKFSEAPIVRYLSTIVFVFFSFSFETADENGDRYKYVYSSKYKAPLLLRFQVPSSREHNHTADN